MLNLLSQISRVLVGVLFIISGLIKANDPMGFGFKLEEYFEVFGMPGLGVIAMPLAILICITEVFLGIALLLGIWRKLVSLSLLGMIVFFTFLTFYSAYFNKVTDCGCFGDAIKLTPWESFTKDVILLVLILIIVRGQQFIKPIFSRQINSLLTFIFLAISIIFPLYTNHYLPVKDFRPYAIGNDIKEQMQVPEGELASPEVELVFIYEKDGQQHRFKTSELPSDIASYTYVDREEKVIREAYEPPIHDFAFTDANGINQTESFLMELGFRVFIVQYDLSENDDASQPELNALFEELLKNDIPVWAATSSSDADIEAFNAPYDFYNMDRTALKTIIRSVPGVLLLHDNKILGKWPSTSLPDMEELKAKMKQYQ